MFSTSFDQTTVEGLIANIDQGRNASVLKVDYFLRRSRSGLPTSDGFAILKAAAEKEPVGTRKWFLLQNVCGFAAFRTPGVSPDEGFEAYNTLFDHAADAPKSNSSYPLRQAIAEFVSAVPGKLQGLGLSTNNETRSTLVSAWTAYLVALETPLPKGSRSAEPEWSTAIEAAHAQETFKPLVEKMLATDATSPQNYVLLTVAARMLRADKPQASLSLLQKAKSQLPRSGGKLDVNEAGRFFDTLVDLLVAQHKEDDAIAAQRERIVLLGEGQAKLLLLYRKSGRAADVERMLHELSQPTANERELNRAAVGLLALERDSATPDVAAGEQAAKLLRGYLAAPRSRSMEEELQARLLLGSYLLNHNKVEEAKFVLVGPVSQQPLPLQTLSQRAQNFLRTIERIRQQLN